MKLKALILAEAVRLMHALRYSFQGIAATVRTEMAFRIELVVAALIFAYLLVSGWSAIIKALVIFSVMLVLLAELANTAIETVIDRISLDQHPLSKKAKDIGSALVFVALVNAGAIWLILIL